MFYAHWSLCKEWPWEAFSPQKIACKGTGELFVHAPSLDKLQALAEALGVHLVINSAYRSAIHNAREGGAPLSQHRLGRAFDLAHTLMQIAQQELLTTARTVGFTGVGLYDTFTHVDTGPSRVWNNRRKK